jgi:hypothetical protein
METMNCLCSTQSLARKLTLLTLALVLSPACGNLSKRRNENAPAANTSAPTESGVSVGAQADAPAPAPAPAARVFKGAIAYKYPIQMSLRRGDGDALTGSYFYEGKGGEITLRGTLDAKGNLTLNEYDGDKQTGTFKGRWREHSYDPAATLDGDWTKAGARESEGFYLVEQHVAPGLPFRLARQTMSEQNKERKYTFEAAYPQLEGASGAGPEAFNRHVRNLVTKAVADFKQGAGADPNETDYSPDAAEDTLNVTYNTRLASEHFISVEFEFEDYEHGAAHPGHSFEVVNFDLRSGQPLKLADLFKPGANYLPAIAARAKEALRLWNKDSATEYGDGTPYLNEPDFDGGADATPENYGIWTLTPKGLTIRFDYYQVGPYAAGAPAIVIPFSDLNDLLRPDGPAAALSLKQ